MAETLTAPQDTKTGMPSLDEKDYNFPSDLLDPEIKKTKKFALKMSKAIYHRHHQKQTYTASRREDWILNRKYSDGNQPNTIYNRQLTRLKNAQGQLISYMDLSFRIVQAIPRFRDTVLSYLEKIDFDIFCDAINPEATLDKEMAKWRIWSERELAPFIAAQEAKAKAGLVNDKNDFVPETMQELELFMQYQFRLQYEISMELGQQMVFYENDWKEIRRQLLKDAFDLGVMAACVYLDRISNRILIRYCDPINMILEDFRGSRGSQMTTIGEFRSMTIGQLKLEAGNQFTDEEYHQIAKSNTGWFGNNDQLAEYNDYINTDVTSHYIDFDNFRIVVMDWQKDSIDRYKFERKFVNGEEMVFDKEFHEPIGKKQYADENGTLMEKEVYPTDVKMVYGAKWIVGSDFIYDYGKSANIPRPLENPKECYKKFKFFRCSNSSYVERMIPFADAIQLAWIRLQNLKARAMPKGLIIDTTHFESVFLDGKKTSTRELIEIAIQTGIVLTRSVSQDDDIGTISQNKPVEETKGGLGAEFTELTQDIFNSFNSIKEVTGFNDTMNAATPDPKSLVGVSELAQTGAQNAVYPLLSALISITEEVSVNISLLIQLLAQYKKLSGYIPSIGIGGLAPVNIGAEVVRTPKGTPVIFGIRIQARATQEQKQRVLAYVDAAIASAQDPTKGGLEVPDGIEISRLIENGTNLKLIASIIGYRLKKFKENQQAIARENIKMDSQEKQAQAKASKDAELELLREKAKIENESYTHHTNEDIRKLRVEYSLRDSNDVVKGNVKKDLEVTKAAKVAA